MDAAGVAPASRLGAAQPGVGAPGKGEGLARAIELDAHPVAPMPEAIRQAAVSQCEARVIALRIDHTPRPLQRGAAEHRSRNAPVTA
jgi:hypothetical protein